MAEARQIYQKALDRITAAALSRDPAAFAGAISLPYELRTVDGTITCRTEDEAHAMLESFSDQLRALDIVRYERTCDTAQFMGRNRITGYHTARAWDSAGTAFPPFLTRLGLLREEDGWRVARSETALRNADWPLLPNWFSAQGKIAKVGTATEADSRLRLFQTILDRISLAFLAGDADGWVGSLSLPCQLVTRHGTEAYETEDAVRADFANYQREFTEHGITDIVREARTAELIEPDLMTGTYTTHILRGAQHVVPPWDASMSLRCENGLWRVTTVMRAIGHMNWGALSPADIEDIPQDTPQKGEDK